MKKKSIIIFSIVCVLILTIVIYFNVATIVIPDNYNLKISNIDYTSEFITYYFYDNTIIKTSTHGGLLSTGMVSTTKTTKYYFNKKVDLSDLMNFIHNSLSDIPSTSENLKFFDLKIEIAEKYEIPYSIDGSHGSELLMKIKGITNHAARTKEIEKTRRDHIKK